MTVRRVPVRTVRRIVELAQRAPSVHNTQPWHWRFAGGRLELYADRSRQLLASDPDGRNLVISCGAVLHHAQVVADALGLQGKVSRLPDPEQPDLLARIEVSPGQPSLSAGVLLDAVARRCTDRRRFTSWPVPDERLTHLAAQATAWSSRALPLSDVSDRFRAELLVNRATDLQAVDQTREREQAQWIDHGAGDGVPSGVLPASSDVPSRRPSRFQAGVARDLGAREVESADGLITICAPTDEAMAWLRAGEALSAMWLEATREGLSLVPLSQVVEFPETRDAFRIEVLGGLAHPLILVRVGWQAIGRSQLTPTPRRPVDEVLDTA